MNRRRRFERAFLLGTCAAAGAAAIGLAAPVVALAANGLAPGNLVVSRSVYTPASLVATDNNTSATPVPADGTPLPPGCTPGLTPLSPSDACQVAINDGTYPGVFNNDLVDGSFGITSDILLDELSPDGTPLGTIAVPSNDVVTSFSSKSELALNLSTNRQSLTFMGYAAPLDSIDVSNSNTPGAVDPTNPVNENVYRVVATLNRGGHWSFTKTNAYSGNNGRAAILDNQDNIVYMAGNAGNGANPQPAGVIEGAGAQMLSPAGGEPESAQTPGATTPVGSFNITQTADVVKNNVPQTDKIGKDDNFRGLTISNNVLYFTKGSGGNGINTVYFVDTTGGACDNAPNPVPATVDPNWGTGLPASGATLPTTPLAIPSDVATAGLPSNMCILRGFPTELAKNDTNFFPFGLWFANPTTLYVADEGSGDNTNTTATATSNGTYSNAASDTMAGLEKWVYNASAGRWQYVYTIQNGLSLGQPYTVPGLPTGLNGTKVKKGVEPVPGNGTGLPWAPATDGLRNLTGRVNPDGSVTIWAVTSTVSGSGDQGADPNKLVEVTDVPSATIPGTESFQTVESAGAGEVLRGVSFTPGTK